MQSNTPHIFLSRAELLLGTTAMQQLAEKRVIVFGIGGVGSWCAECLVRTGITHITLVDCDVVSPSNINRQLMATTLTIGQPKVDVLRERLLTINPQAEIVAINKVFCEETASEFVLDSFDYVIDAIDSLKDKTLLILRASASRAQLFSSMGAALKLDPSRIRVAEFWKVSGDPLARALRKKFKSRATFPDRKFLCVYSDELLQNQGEPNDSQSIQNQGESNSVEPSSPINKPNVNGSLAHITAIFGFTLASLVIRSAIRED